MGGDGAASLTVELTGLERDGGVDEPYVATAAEEVYGAVDVAVFIVGLHDVVGAVIRVLIGEHTDALADGAVAVVLHDGSTAAHLSGTEGTIVVEGILQGEILQVESGAGDVEHVGRTETLDALVGRCPDDGTVHRFADDRDVMAADGGLYSLVEVVGAVGQEDEGALGILGCIGAVDDVEHIEEAAGIAGLDDIPAAETLIVGLAGVGNLHAVEIHLARGVHGEGEGAPCAFVVEGNDLAIGLLGADAWEGAYLLAVLSDDDVVGIAIAAEGE